MAKPTFTVHHHPKIEMGTLPNGSVVISFEARDGEARIGFALTDAELLDFAAKLRDTAQVAKQRKRPPN